jgi:hypothetical protein
MGYVMSVRQKEQWGRSVMDVGMESTERYEGYKIGPCSGKDIEWNE